MGVQEVLSVLFFPVFLSFSFPSITYFCSSPNVTLKYLVLYSLNTSLNSREQKITYFLSFENISFDHVRQIKSALGIAGVHTETYSWKGKESQIDMVIDRDDRLINLCECKYSSVEYTIDKEYDAKLRNRQIAFIEEGKVKKSTILTFITPFGLKRNEYSGRIPHVITAEDLFK